MNSVPWRFPHTRRDNHPHKTHNTGPLPMTEQSPCPPWQGLWKGPWGAELAAINQTKRHVAVTHLRISACHGWAGLHCAETRIAGAGTPIATSIFASNEPTIEGGR